MSAADLPHIREGTVADAPASIREVAARAGVSVGTVSNALHRPDIVAEPTRSRVRATIKQLGFIKNASARQLRAGRSRTIGPVVLDVANPFLQVPRPGSVLGVQHRQVAFGPELVVRRSGQARAGPAG
jgi:regulatory LacI family protein